MIFNCTVLSGRLLKFGCSRSPVIKCLEDIPMYVLFVLHEHENLYTTFEQRATGILDFNRK